MDADLLRRACVMAGLITRMRAFVGWEAGISMPNADRWYDNNDPALPAYVASRLVAMVQKDELRQFRYQSAMAHEVGAGIGFSARAMFATDEQRIRAALKVLEGKR